MPDETVSPIPVISTPPSTFRVSHGSLTSGVWGCDDEPEFDEPELDEPEPDVPEFDDPVLDELVLEELVLDEPEPDVPEFDGAELDVPDDVLPSDAVPPAVEDGVFAVVPPVCEPVMLILADVPPETVSA